MQITSLVANKQFDKRFIILTIAVSVSGFSQGLLLPLLSVILENQGVSSTINGLSSSALYVGMLLANPFMETPVRKYGFKSVIIFGMLLVMVPILLFPVWTNLLFWVLLRFIVGIGDTALHFATQVWITSTVEKSKRGRSISIYGLSYGVGFGVGPLGLVLLPYGQFVPFLVAAFFLVLVLILVLSLQNEFPKESKQENYGARYLKVYSIAGFALMPMFIYGVLEATLNSTFPIYGLRVGLDKSVISLILSIFVAGSLVFQLPLGILSDYVGRRSVLIFITIIGGGLFLFIPMIELQLPLLLMFAFIGSLLGSLYSLGLAYVADLVPPGLLPTANIVAGIHFGIGSIIGPFIGGGLIDKVSPGSLFYFISIIVISFAIFTIIEGALRRNKKAIEVN